MWLVRAIRRPFHGVRAAREHLEQSERDKPAVRELGGDLRVIDAENHISRKVHNAARGRPDR